MLGLVLGVEALGDPLDVERLAEPLSDLGDGDVPGRLELGQVDDEAGELGEEEIAGLIAAEVVVARVGPAPLAGRPLPEALPALPVDEDQQVLVDTAWRPRAAPRRGCGRRGWCRRAPRPRVPRRRQLGDLAEGELGVARRELERAASLRLRPAELLDEQPVELEALEQLAGAGDVEAAHDAGSLRRPNEQMMCGSPGPSSSRTSHSRSSSRRLRTSFGQVAVRDPGAELAVEGLDRHRAQREAVDLVDRPVQLGEIEEGALDRGREPLEPLVGAEAGARRAAELAAGGALLLGDQLDRALDQAVVILAPGQGRLPGSAGGGLEDRELRVGDAPALGIHPGQRVVALAGAQVDEGAGRGLLALDVPARGVDDVGEGRDLALERRIVVDGVLPDLVGVGGQVDVAVGVAVEDARLLVVEIDQDPIVAVVFEERLVGADHLGVLAQAGADAAAQADDALDAVGREEGVGEDLLGPLADPVDAAHPLDEPDDRPGQIVVDDDAGVLEVLALGEDVGGQEDAQLVAGGHLVALLVAPRAEAPGEPRWGPRSRRSPRRRARRRGGAARRRGSGRCRRTARRRAPSRRRGGGPGDPPGRRACGRAPGPSGRRRGGRRAGRRSRCADRRRGREGRGRPAAT